MGHRDTSTRSNRLMDVQDGNKPFAKKTENLMMDIWNALVMNMMTLEKGNPLRERRCGSSLEERPSEDDSAPRANRRTQEYLAYLYHPAL
jgi:hypothetical protein